MTPPDRHPAVPLDELLAQALRLDPAAIDALYGLEPVYEPDAGEGDAELHADLDIDCPHCHAPQLLRVDLTAGREQAYVEDCQICCRSIAVRVVVDERGALAHGSVERSDG